MGSSSGADDGTPPANGRGSNKRKSSDAPNDNGTSHTRSKRNRYISIACNECKRRKIKCNGQTPCQRCGNLSLECVYAPNCCTNSLKDSVEFQQMRDQINTLQDQVNELWTNLNGLRSRPEIILGTPNDGLFSPDPHGRSSSLSTSRTLPPLMSSKNRTLQKTLPPVHGPTSSAYGIDVAKSSLQNMGITSSAQDDGTLSRERSRAASPQPISMLPLNKDPLWLIDHTEVVRLCHVYEEEIGITYPIVEIDKVLKHASSLYRFIQAALRTGYGNPNKPGADSFDDEDTLVLKMILAITLTVEGSGRSELGQRFFEYAKPSVDLKLVTALDLRSIVLVIMTATYYFHQSEEVQAWRFIGIAARMCLELGLHQKDSLVRSFTNEAEYNHAICMFWTVYALDRRWSFGTGMPLALQDSDIDSSLPEPDDSQLYLKHITRFNQIATKVWDYSAAFEKGRNTQKDEIGFLDYQVQEWYRRLPELLQFNNHDLARENQIPSRSKRRLRLLMYLRRNQLRINIYRPILHSATSIMENRHLSQDVIDIAKETISTLTGINQTSDIYRTQQITFNYFLVQALAVIFLSVAHAPAIFCSQTRQEFYAAIELIKGFSTKSYVSKRLWKTIRGLKEMGDKIGMLARGGAANIGADADQDAHSNAAVAMAGLAGHKVDFSPYGNNNNNNPARPQGMDELGVSPEDAMQMSNELSSLFELAGGGYGNFGGATPGPDGFASFLGTAGDGTGLDLGLAGFGNEPEFARIMNELF